MLRSIVNTESQKMYNVVVVVTLVALSRNFCGGPEIGQERIQSGHFLSQDSKVIPSGYNSEALSQCSQLNSVRAEFCFPLHRITTCPST
jgi:hypothetical protein